MAAGRAGHAVRVSRPALDLHAGGFASPLVTKSRSHPEAFWLQSFAHPKLKCTWPSKPASFMDNASLPAILQHGRCARNLAKTFPSKYKFTHEM